MYNYKFYEELYTASDFIVDSVQYVDHHHTNWGNGAFIGNGMLGAMIFKKTPDGITLELGRNDIEAHNHLGGIDWTVPRVPIGDLKIYSHTKVLNESIHLHLYKAYADGEVKTEDGIYKWESFCANSLDVFVIRLSVLEGKGSLDLELIPEWGVSPRLYCVEEELAKNANPLPPKPQKTSENGINGWRQPLVNDNGEIEGGFSVAVATVEENGVKTYFVAVEHNRTGDDAWGRATEIASMAKAKGYDKLFKEHCEFWKNYYNESYLSFSNKKWQDFYNLQMYKLASATREDAVEVIDSQGPWLTKTGWPGTWWNLNVQLSYSPLYTSNHLKTAKSLINTIKKYETNLRKNAMPVTNDGIYIHRASGRQMTRNNIYTPQQIKAGNYVCFELGNITWILFTIYRHYRYSMDEALMKETLFPLLKAAVNVFMAILWEDDDGVLHLPKTTSPEYPGPINPKGNTCPCYDTAYDISLLRWGLETLILLNDENGFNDGLYAKWCETLERLVDVPIDETGIMVGAGMPYEISHRHYSHLFPIFPLHQLDLEDSEQRALAEKSLNHWQSLPEKLVGYSCTGASCMASALGDGNRALKYLDKMYNLDKNFSYVTPNTMYLEPVGGPVIETPITASEAVHYMLLQSYNRRVRVFPAVPDSFENVHFERLLADGAFEVSAHREDGINKWVKVKSLKGGVLDINIGLKGEVNIDGAQAEKICGDRYKLNMEAGKTVTFYIGDISEL